MKKNTITSVIGAFGFAGLATISPIFAQDAVPPTPEAPTMPELSDAEVKEILSYFLGFQSSSQFAQSGLTTADLNSADYEKGFSEGFKGGQPSYSQEKIQNAMMKFQEKMQARQEKIAADNLAKGAAFLAENGKREGVTTTESGLQYEVITKGGDEKYVAPTEGPDNGTKFMVHYRGTLIDGTEFDKSADGEAFPMTLQVIPGFKEALTTMPVGAKWKIFLPAELAYGPRAAGPQIGPNSTLIFELELTEIVAAPAPATPSPGSSAVTPPIPVPAAE